MSPKASPVGGKDAGSDGMSSAPEDDRYVHALEGVVMCTYHIVGKFGRRIFHDFALKQTFCGINFAICMLIVCLYALILTISQIDIRELDQIAKNTKFLPCDNFPLYGTYTQYMSHCYEY